MLFVKYLHAYRVRKSFSNCLKELAKCQHILFLSYLKKDYLYKRIQFEKKLFKRRMTMLSVFQRARLLKKNSFEKSIFLKLEHLVEIVFSLHLLRLRIDDYSIFTFCKLELTSLAKISTELLFESSRFILRRKQCISVDIFLDHIHAFEAIYSRTLQVICKEPIVFLFFIQDLYAFYDELLSLGVMHERI